MQGWGEVGHTGWGVVLWRGRVCHGEVRCVMDGLDGVGCVMERWGGVCDVGVGWDVNNFMSQVRVSVFSSDKLLSTAFWIMWDKACFCL